MSTALGLISGNVAAVVRRAAFKGSWWSQALLAMLVALLLTGCDSGTRLPVPRYDEELSEALIRTLEESQTVQLAELTDFDWDTVYVFRSYVDGESINTTVGQDVVRSSYLHGSDAENVLIFVLDGSLAHAAEVPRVGIGPRASVHFVEASSGAWLAPSDPDRRGSSLNLVEQLPDE